MLQVLIGRDGSVQDAKFLQGSLLFARNAIDGVKSWKFKPYAMNGRRGFGPDSDDHQLQADTVK